MKGDKKKALKFISHYVMPKPSGFVQAAVMAMILLVIGMSIAVVSQVIGTTIAAKAYKTVEADIAGISDANIKKNSTDAIISAFSAQKTNADFLPLMLLAIVLSVITILLFGSLRAGMGSAPGGASF